MMMNRTNNNLFAWMMKMHGTNYNAFQMYQGMESGLYCNLQCGAVILTEREKMFLPVWRFDSLYISRLVSYHML